MSDGRFLVWGAGGHGRVVADAVLALGWDLWGFVDSDSVLLGKQVPPFDVRVIASEDDMFNGIASCEGARVFPAIGANLPRLAGVDRLADRCAPPLIHPSAVVSPFTTLGLGTVVLAGALINVGVAVGRGAIINTGAVVEHDCALGDGCHVSPGAVIAGGVTLGRLAWVGANATIFPGVVVGEQAVVGAGAVVRRSVEAHTVVVGNPAKPLYRTVA